MPTEQYFYDSQVTGEAKKYTADFGEFIPTGGSISSVAGSYAQSFSATGASLVSGSCTATATGGSLYTLVTPALTDTGSYSFAATATLSDGQIREAIWFVRVDR